MQRQIQAQEEDICIQNHNWGFSRAQYIKSNPFWFRILLDEVFKCSDSEDFLDFSDILISRGESGKHVISHVFFNLKIKSKKLSMPAAVTILSCCVYQPEKTKMQPIDPDVFMISKLSALKVYLFSGNLDDFFFESGLLVPPAENRCIL